MTISQFYGTRVVVVVLAPKYVFAIYGLLLFRGRRIETTETFLPLYSSSANTAQIFTQKSWADF
jgi:hypothetical protein